ncbi:MAG: HEAT repeat domain-containing protein, partial [Gammaproteobacteria bacterium]|nr:HEAT repeat domain-containing protein [Gammaproteobacteria bacterium]
LVKRLDDEEDVSVRRVAAEALGRLGDSSAAPALVKRLDDEEDVSVRRVIAEALGRLGDSSVAPELIRLLGDENSSVREYAAEALGRLGDSSVAPELVRLLGDENSSVRQSAAEALGSLGDSLIAPELIRLLGDENSSVREYATEALGRLGDSSVVLELVKLLADEDSYVRRTAAEALGRLGDSSVAPALVKLLADEDEDVRRNTAEALGRLGDSSVAPALVKLLSDEAEDAEVRRTAVWSLGQLDDSSVAPELVKLLADEDENAGVRRAAAANALISMGIIFPELSAWQEKHFLAAQENLENDEKQKAAAALGFIFTEQSVSLLSSLLADANKDVVKATVESLGIIGEYHPGLVQAQVAELLNLINHDDLELRQTAITALGRLISFRGKETAADLPDLEQSVHVALRKIVFDSQQDLAIRLVAIDALGATDRQDCAKDLYELLTKLDDSLRYRSVMWLGRMIYRPGQSYIEDELKQLEQEKAAWRQERDSKKQEDKTWRKEHWEYMLGNALMRIDPKVRGIDLLNHPLYQVRQGAIRALASRIADGTDGTDGAALIGKIIQAHQDFDPDDLPSPSPYAAFQATDLALWNLENTGKKDDVSKLKDILKKLQPCQVPGQEGAIKERLEWTIKRLEENLARNAVKAAAE